MLKKLTRM